MLYNIYLLLGHTYRLTGDTDVATDHYLKAQKIYPKDQCNDKYQLTVVYQQLCVYAASQNDKALEGLKPLLACEDLSISTRGILHQSLGNIYRSIADFHSAQTHFKESIRLGRDEGDEYKVAERKAELGRVYRSSGCHSKALKRQKNFLEYCLSHGYTYSVSVSCGYIGFTYYSMGKQEYVNALKYLYTRLQLCRTMLKDTAGYRWSLNNIGKVYLGLGEHEICMGLFTESGNIAKRLGNNLGLGTAYGNMGSACRAVGKYEEAIKYHRLYLEIAEKMLDTGGIAIMQNELILDHLFIYKTKVSVDEKKVVMDRARECACQAIRTGLEVRGRLSSEDDLLKIGNFEKNQSKTYSLLQFILVTQGYHEAALLVAEYGRARALADLVTKKWKDESSPILANIMDIFSTEGGNVIPERVSVEIRSIGSLLDGSHLLLYSIIEDPLKGGTLLYTWHIDPSSDNISFNEKPFNQSSKVTTDEAVFDEEYFRGLIYDVDAASKGIVAPRDIVPKKLKTVVALARPNPVKVRAKNKFEELYEVLIQSTTLAKSVSNESPRTQRLVIVPHGSLFGVPFCALKDPASGQYLIERFVISYTPSVYLLQLTTSRKARLVRQVGSDLSILSVGNPTMPFEEVPQLPGAEKESKSLMSIFDGVLLCGNEATKGRVTECIHQFSIVHLATHALLGSSFDDSDSQGHSSGDYSVKGGVVLAKSDPSCSGILTSAEIQDLDLNTELFVLSCCKTGGGKVTGDGILGLSRSLMVAGACSMIVTLWPIPDAPTVLLMNAFYKEYKMSRDGPASLRKSMLSLIEQGYKVEQWAAFCYIGK